MNAEPEVWPGSLLDWVACPTSGCGVRTLHDGTWHLTEYPELAARVRSAAAQLAGSGVLPGDVVAICDPDCLGFISAFFGTLFAGATPAPLPSRSADPADLTHHIRGVLQEIRPAVLVAGIEVETQLAAVTDQPRGVTKHLVLTSDTTEDVPRAPMPELALLQFSSGSTGTPRGIQIATRNIDAQVQSLAHWHRYRSSDAFVSWLPLHHDMGLVGLLLAPILTQLDLWQMRPDQFLLEPLTWLRCLDHGKASITAAPTFGYAYAARRIRPNDLDGLDFSRVRSAIVGAEPLSPRPLRDFAKLLEPRGCSAGALRPAYGLAEATLAVTGSSSTHPPRTVRVDWAQAVPNEALPVSSPSPLMSDLPAPAGTLVSSGVPLDGTTVNIVDDEGIPLPDGYLGEIAVRGPSVACGYRDQPTTTTTRFTGDALYTGDAGFLTEGQLFVVGRIADSVKVRGRRVYAEPLEHRIASDASMSTHRFVVIPAVRGVDNGIAVLVEGSLSAEQITAIERSVRRFAGRSLATEVVQVPPGTIARTTSGKIRRRFMWHQLATGQLVGGTLMTNQPRPEIPDALLGDAPQ